MSLLDLLLQGPSASDRYQQIAPLLGGGRVPGNLGGGFGPTPPGNSGPISDVEAAARRFFLSHGYSRPDWRKVDAIIDEGVGSAAPESSWNPHAFNESSGAAGLAQKISGFDRSYREDDPMSQIRWLYNYLDTHQYPGLGSGVDAAYEWKRQHGWY